MTTHAERANRLWHPDEAMQDALSGHPDCTYAEWTPGLDFLFQMTVVVQLWRNQECWAAGDPCRTTEDGYPKLRYADYPASAGAR